MFCSHCGYELSEEKRQNIYVNANPSLRKEGNVMTYVCPRCGSIIKDNLNEEDVKSLSRAAHAEIHRSRNLFNSGMCFLMIAVIILAISIMFLLMSYKANQGGRLVVECTEFYVFIATLVLGILSLGYSLFNLIRGFKKHHTYTNLLKDIQNGIFNQ